MSNTVYIFGSVMIELNNNETVLGDGVNLN